MKPLAFRRSLQEVPKGPEPPKDRRLSAAVWAAAKVGFSRLSVFVSPEPIAFRRWTFSEDLEASIAWFHLLIVAPATLAAFSVSGMGPIYDVPLKHRTLPQGDKQPGDQDNASGKLEDPRQRQD